MPSPGKTAEWEPDRIPEDLKEVWDTIRLHRNFTICRWEFDSQEKQAFLYVIDIRDENDVRDLQGVRINNWTIQVFYDAEYEKERNLAWEAFMNIEKDPGLDIAAFDMGSDEVITCPTCEGKKVERILSLVGFSTGDGFKSSGSGDACGGCTTSSCSGCSSAH